MTALSFSNGKVHSSENWLIMSWT